MTKGVSMPSLSTVSVTARTINAQKKNAPPKKNDSLVWSGEISEQNASKPKIYTLDEATRSPEQFVRFFAMSEQYADSIGASPTKTRNKMQRALGASVRRGADEAEAAIVAYNNAMRRFIDNARFINALRERVPHLARVRLAGCELAAFYATAEQVFRVFGYMGAESINESRDAVKDSMKSADESDKKKKNAR